MPLWNSIEGPVKKFWDLQGVGFIHVWACLYARLRMRPRVGVPVVVAPTDRAARNSSHSHVENGSHSWCSLVRLHHGTALLIRLFVPVSKPADFALASADRPRLWANVPGPGRDAW